MTELTLQIFISGVVVLLIMVLITVVIWVNNRRLSQQVDLLTHAIEQVTAGDFSITIDTNEFNELERLAASFNEMITNLHDSKVQFQTIYNTANAIIMAHDTDFNVVYMNPYACKALGYEEGEMMGKNINSMIEDSEVKRADPVREQVAIDPELRIEGFEQYYLKKNGGRILINWNVTALKDVHGKAIGILGVGQDITERKKAEEELKKHRDHLEELVEQRTAKISAVNKQLQQEIDERQQAEAALRESEARYRELFNTMNSGVAVYEAVDAGQDFEFREFNAAGEEIEGVSAKDLLGKRVTEVFPGITASGILATFKRVWHSGQSEYMPEVIYQDEDRGPTWREIWTYKLPPNEIVAIYNDITERKEIELQFQRLSRVVEQSSDLVVITNRNGIITYVNPAFEKFSGYPAGEAVGLTPAISKSGKHEPQIYKQLWNTILDGNTWYGTLINKRKDGTEYFEEKVITPLRNSSGAITHFVSTGRDVTERIKAEEELRQAKETAEAANQAKSTFLANMSHELRTPLNAVLGYTQILKQDLSLSSYLQDLNTIQRSGEHLLQLINDILDLAKVEAGKVELYPQPFDLPNFIRNVCEMMQVRAEAKNLYCSRTVKSLPQIVFGDEYRLRQILVNLLGNAIKFTEEGGVSLMVEPVPDSDDLIRFQVTDTGPGIAPEYIPAVFEPFEQAGDHKHQRKGTGLGLTISQELVEIMGGTLQVESELDQGSTFWFQIPLPEVASASQPVFQAAHAVTGIKGQSPKILVVDDEADNRKVVIDVLEPLGFVIAEAKDGIEGLNQLSAFEPDAIILDLIMPKMDGFELIERIRQSPEMEHISLIVSSARSYNEDRERSFAIGANAFVPKPVELSTLLDTLQQQLRIEWIYGDEAGTVNEMEEPIVFPAPDVMSELVVLANLGDIAGLQQYADKLIESDDPQLTPFVAKLRQFMENFQINQLQAFLGAHREA